MMAGFGFSFFCLCYCEWFCFLWTRSVIYFTTGMTIECIKQTLFIALKIKHKEWAIQYCQTEASRTSPLNERCMTKDKPYTHTPRPMKYENTLMKMTQWTKSTLKYIEDKHFYWLLIKCSDTDWRHEKTFQTRSMLVCIVQVQRQRCLRKVLIYRLERNENTQNHLITENCLTNANKLLRFIW